MAWFVSDAVDALNLAAFHARYTGDGRRRQPFNPAMMVKWRVEPDVPGVEPAADAPAGLDGGLKQLQNRLQRP